MIEQCLPPESVTKGVASPRAFRHLASGILGAGTALRIQFTPVGNCLRENLREGPGANSTAQDFENRDPGRHHLTPH
ncbi:hypothetical protein NM688_g9051 [Phlebia brevispora]|uniref:Uncharacterized protein n=1 Tax=Phlebia brevispora TaxID=194682 RepID=A0ACC1RJW1_9APHY|nr:hypothetical protein NM688_g9051 [Phlebia brevispora]